MNSWFLLLIFEIIILKSLSLLKCCWHSYSSQPIFWRSSVLVWSDFAQSLRHYLLSTWPWDLRTVKLTSLMESVRFLFSHMSCFFLLAKEEASATEIRKLGWRESNFPVLKIVSWKAALLRKAVRFHSCFQERPCSPQMFFHELFNSLKLKHSFLTSPTLFIVLNCWPECTITLWNKSPLNHVYFRFGYDPWKLVWIFCILIRLMLHTIILSRVYPENNPRLAVVVLKAIFLCWPVLYHETDPRRVS